MASATHNCAAKGGRVLRHIAYLGALCGALFVTAANAQPAPKAAAKPVAKAAAPAKAARWVSPPQAGRPPLKARPIGDKAIIRTMADALGLVRNVGIVETTETVNRLQWNGTGTVGGQPADYTYALSFHLSAAREDIRPKSGGKRVVRVVYQDKAWDETAPGVGQTWANGEAAARRLQFARNPFGFAKAVLKADPSSVKVDDGGPGGVVKIALTIDGAPTVAELDPDYRPRRITMTAGGRTIVSNYSDYSDLSEYGIMFPKRIVETTDGRPNLDIRLSDVRVASYVVFPPPAP